MHGSDSFGFLANCSCMHGFYFFILCPVFNAPVCNIQVCKSCLFVVLKQLYWQRRSVCMCTGTEMLQYWLSTGSWMLCRTTMYINTQLQNIKLKWTSQIPLSYSLYELHSHFFHTFPTLCDLVLSVWRHLFSYTTFFASCKLVHF